MPATRSNRMEDWTQLMSIKSDFSAKLSIATKQEFKKELVELNLLPTFPKITPASSRAVNPNNERQISNELLDTSMYQETATPPQFGIELLPHQKRGLTWMLSVENANMPIIIKNSNNKQVRVFGGILADKPGTGKSVLMIALMNLNKCTGFFKEDQNRTRSKGTLLLCPRNIVDQWKKELFRCDATLRVVEITTTRMLHTISSLEIALADVILLPYYLLADPMYITNCGQVDRLNPPALTTFEDLSKYKGILTRFHFHRVVYDEVHEIYDQTRNSEFEFVPFMETFHSNWRWGITGTPPADAILFSGVLDCIARADIKMNIGMKMKALKQKIVRSNNPDLGIPPKSHEIIWIDLTSQEIAMYNLFRSSSTNEQIMACSHFNITNVPINALGTSESMTLDEVSKILLDEHAAKILTMQERDLPNAEERIPILESKLANTRSRLACVTNDEIRKDMMGTISRYKAGIRRHRNMVVRCLRDIPKLQNELAYFQNILQSLRTDEEQACPICLDEFQVGHGHERIGLTQCGHAFCKPCLAKLGNAPCPQCRKPIHQETIMYVKLHPDAQDGILCDIFGSKIHQMVLFIVAQLSIDPTFKFIVFSQFSKLASVVTKACIQYELNAVNLCGAVKVRSNALRKFHEGNYPVLLMSAEQSVSGVNITCASHVLILHPFNLGSDAESVSAEQQGIARAHRLGQTRAVKVVRFVTRGTVEEKMTRTRLGGKWIED